MIRLLGDPLAQSFNAAVWSGEGEGVALLSGDILHAINEPSRNPLYCKSKPSAGTLRSHLTLIVSIFPCLNVLPLTKILFFCSLTH